MYVRLLLNVVEPHLLGSHCGIPVVLHVVFRVCVVFSCDIESFKTMRGSGP